MKVSVEFNESGLRLFLKSENEGERSMVGAVIGQPTPDRYVDNALIVCEAQSSAHYTYGKVDTIVLSISKRQDVEEPRKG